MPSSIWTRCAGDSKLTALRLQPWRVVESQHQIATRKLVDSDSEQALLEELIDRAKPPDATRGRLHYLLATPFRYPPLPYGSRFGTREELGIWYGSEALRTAFAEVAYYRLLFLEGTSADLGLVEVELTAFRAAIRTRRGIDLTVSPFARYQKVLASRTDYRQTQALGSTAREKGVEVLRYQSARDSSAGSNVAVLSPGAFGRREPRGFETWHCSATHEHVEFLRRDYFERASHAFQRAEFLVAGKLPAPAP